MFNSLNEKEEEPIIVRFKNGLYALRRKQYGEYKYLDLRDNYWWSKGDSYFHYCLGTLEEIEKRLMSVDSDFGEPI